MAVEAPSPDDDGAGEPSDDWSCRAVAGGLRLHYLDSGPDPRDPPHAGLPVLFVPGFGEEAAEHRPLLEALRPRRAVAVDLRGRGRSDHPTDGYLLERHVDDVDAIVDAAGLDRVHVVSYSRGTTYALSWALRHPDRVASVLVGDYPAVQMVPPDWFVRAAARGNWRGRPIADRMSPAAVGAMVADAVDVDLWPLLPTLGCPALIIRAGGPGAILDDAGEQRYRAAFPDLEVVHFEASGHDLWDPDPTCFAATVRAFTDRVERGMPDGRRD